jgi:hypothetical protein
MKGRRRQHRRSGRIQSGGTVNRHRAPLTIVAAAGLALASVSAQITLRTFDEDAIGTPPGGFTFATARQQTPGRWLVRADGSNRYLTHLADSAAAGGFALAVLDTPHPAQMRASVRLKLTEGERVGGLVWRYQDAENFYVAALDLRLQEVALYRVVRGNRIRLDEEDELELDDSAWHSLRVVQDEDDIRVSLGGIGVMRARDRTVAEGGRAGVWSGGGATSWFDDFRVEPHEARRRRR